MGMVSQLVARVRKSQPGSSSVHVNAPLGSEKDRVVKATDDNPAVNNQGVELAVEALWPEELDAPLAVAKADETVGARRRAERRQAVDNAVDNPGITTTADVEKGGPGSGPHKGESGGRGHELEKAAFEAKFKSLGAGKENGLGHFHSGGHTRDEAKSKAVALREGGTHATIWHVDGPKTGKKSSYAVAVPHKSSVHKGGPGSGPQKGGGSGPHKDPERAHDTSETIDVNADGVADLSDEQVALNRSRFSDAARGDHGKNPTTRSPEEQSAALHDREAATRARAEKKPKEKKDPQTMTVGELQKESEKLSTESSKLTRQLIDEGHGSLRYNDMHAQKDTNPLFQKAVDNADRHRKLHDEAARRGGPGFSISHLSGIHNRSRVHKAAEPRRVATVAIRVGDHLLMGQRRDNDKWTTPGGHCDPGEDFHAGALREALEETGIELDPDDVEPLTDVHELTDKEGAPLHVQPFHAVLDERPSTSMQDDPDGEVYRWQWVDISNGLPEELRDELHTPLQYNVLMQALGLSDAAETDEDAEPLKLDLGSGQARAPGHIGVDLYAYDDATLVHDVSMGLPFEDSSADSVRLVNALHDMDELSTDPAPLLAEILRVLQPGGVFHYEGPHEITDFPEGLDETDHVESVVKEGDAPGWHQQTFERAATADAATSDDADPRGAVAEYDMLPPDAMLALDATANAWSDVTSSGRGNRVHGYPSQGALVAKSAAVDFVQRLLGRERTEVAEPDRFTHVAKIGLANRAKQIIYCVVLSPEESDQQEDFMLAEDIEIAAHRYLLTSRVVGAMHTKVIKAAPVESYIAPFDMKWDSGPYGPQTVKKGAWVVGLKIFDAGEWAKVEDGTYQSVSVSGIGLRDDMN